MISAYHTEGLQNLLLIKEAKIWQKNEVISGEQFTAIRNAHLSKFYHPNLMIRLLLFIASWIAISGVTGFFFLIVEGASQEIISVMAILYGIVVFVFTEKIFIQNSHHYKSGVTEGLLYHAAGFVLGGMGGLTDFNEHVMLVCCVLVFAFTAIRYHDVITTLLAIGSLGAFVFYELYEMGGTLQHLIPLAMLVVFTPLYVVFRNLKKNISTYLWTDCITAVEVLSLLIICAAGNYLVVRELSIELLNIDLEPGEDIPLAFVFYFLTVVIPVGYLAMGILKKDVVLLRVSIVAIAFAVFTFEYYFFHGLHEVFITFAGAFVLVSIVLLYRYLKTPRKGFTHEKIWDESDIHLEAFVVSQTMGGNQATAEHSQQGGGGTFGGGGASGDF
jgi:hypothetical protein